MPKATLPGGSLIEIRDCYIVIPRFGPIYFDNLPDITDSKTATYNDEVVIGRSSPLKTYSQSDNRNISMQIHLFITKPSDVTYNLSVLRAVESAVYPRTGGGGAPFYPPPICRMKCGKLLADNELCVILKSYSVKFPTEVAWATLIRYSENNIVPEPTFTPFKFDIDTTWDVVYKSADLPGQERILQIGK